MGATLVAIGVLFLLDRADVLDAGQVIGDWWPAVIVGFGLVNLAERPVSLLGPVLLIAVGVLLLLVTNDVLDGGSAVDRRQRRPDRVRADGPGPQQQTWGSPRPR